MRNLGAEIAAARRKNLDRALRSALRSLLPPPRDPLDQLRDRILLQPALTEADRVLLIEVFDLARKALR